MGTCLDNMIAGGRTQLFALSAPTSFARRAKRCSIRMERFGESFWDAALQVHLAPLNLSFLHPQLSNSISSILVNRMWSQGRYGLELEMAQDWRRSVLGGVRGLLPTALLVIVSTALALALVAPQWDPRADAWLLTQIGLRYFAIVACCNTY